MAFIMLTEILSTTDASGAPDLRTEVRHYNTDWIVAYYPSEVKRLGRGEQAVILLAVNLGTPIYVAETVAEVAGLLAPPAP